MDEPSHRRRSLVVVTALLYVTLAGLRASANAPACCQRVRPQDQLWLVSDRGLGCRVESEADRLRYWRLACQQGWTRASLDELLAAEDRESVTIVFVHGNQIPSCEAFTKGWRAYRTLVSCSDERPVRFVIWSWPSDKVHGAVEDARAKAARTNLTAYYLAWFVDRLDPDAPLSLWGHSFGSRAITGALHLLGGGAVAGNCLQRVHAQRLGVQVVLMAAALDNHWLLPGHFHGQALSQTSGLLLVNNGCDRLLKRYHWLYGRRSCRRALGYTGLYRGLLPGGEQAKLRQIDACSSVGHQHQFALYLASPGVMSRARATLLFDRPRAEPIDGPELASAAEVQTSGKSSD